MICSVKKVQNSVKTFLSRDKKIKDIVTQIDRSGGRALLVGGAVRDLFLDIEPKDIDIEVQGVKFDQLQKILKIFGSLSLVGKSFGVLRINGLDVDWSLPRKDSRGRKPQVIIDPQMSIKDAFARRDLTINAMGIDLITLELVDPFGGLSDLKHKKLRVPDKKLFVEDPLRFFRVMQFIGRFEMKPDKELNMLCARMDLSGVSRERIEEEFKKLFLKSRRPSLGIDWLAQVGRLQEILPELYQLIGIKQDPKWHPEGECYGHTLQVLDAVEQLSFKSDHEKLMMCWAALCHDLGKILTSDQWKDGGISAHGHEQAGVPLTKKLMKRITHDNVLIAGVCKLVQYHMQPGQFIENKAKPAAYKRLANKLAPEISLELLAHFSCADKRGRNPKSRKPLRSGCGQELLFMRRAKKLAVLQEPEKPVLRGRDLLDVIKPGPVMGKLLKKAYEIQLQEGIKSKKILKKRVLAVNKQTLVSKLID